MNQRRREVLDHLTAAGAPVGVSGVAQALGVHANTVRFHLQALIEQGRVERVGVTTDRPGRPTMYFRAVPGMDPGGPRHYQALARVLVGSVAAGPEPVRHATEAGRRWGRELAADAPAPSGRSGPMRRLEGLLDDMGFSPVRAGSARQPRIGLHHCPFLELAREEPGVICSMHRGLMEGALAEFGSELGVSALDAFAEPDLCVARLAPKDERR